MSASSSGIDEALPPRIEGPPVGTPISPADRAAAERLSEMRQRALGDARANAEKWAAAAATVFTALGITTIVEGSQRIRALRSGWPTAVGIDVTAAFALALGSTVMATAVAHRLSTTALIKRKAPELLAYEETLADRVEKTLRRSQALVSVAVVLVILGLAGLMLAPNKPGPRAPTASSALRVVTVLRDGELVCGTLRQQDESGRLRIATAAGPIRELNAHKALSITPVSSCPAGTASSGP